MGRDRGYPLWRCESIGQTTTDFSSNRAEIPTSTAAQWPGVNGNSTYSEKLDVGYRWYDADQVQPLFPFGYGLSYRTFNLSDLRVTPGKLLEWIPRRMCKSTYG